MQIKFISTDPNRPPSLLRKIAALIAMVALAVVAIMFSVVLLSVILVVIVFGGAYLWWKTRELRKLMRDFTPPPGATMHCETFADEAFKGEVIEGEVIRVDESRIDESRIEERR